MSLDSPLTRRIDSLREEQRAKFARKTRQSDQISQLSPRQKQILACVCDGIQNKQIAFIMGLHERTVEEHRRELMARTGSMNAVQLGMWAERNGFGCKVNSNIDGKCPSGPTVGAVDKLSSIAIASLEMTHNDEAVST